MPICAWRADWCAPWGLACAYQPPNAEYKQLTAEDKIEIEEAFANYQRALLVIAGKNKLHVKPVMDYVGQESPIRGPTNFNDFCVKENKRKRRRGTDGDDPECPYDECSKVANCKRVWVELRKALRTKTSEKLAKLKVTLLVKKNNAFLTAADFCHWPSDMSLGTSQRVLTTFAKGWVKLTGPPPPKAVVGGVSTVGHDPSNAAVGNNLVPSTPSAKQPGTQVSTRPLKGVIRRPKKTVLMWTRLRSESHRRESCDS
ncbi:hypothetical protein PGTUg99_029822 [Puccinia graminis f. sp. tritici]|uniref:Uncharacterized protein n=1 Tax=Puccinia graminis f. sp. tritici TaxID=56615 RepID=A0A5B0RU52_PUCGR|nr:hypothetical protein PGTUg99_029822 [Puccinia graminis f. sp. tritici]